MINDKMKDVNIVNDVHNVNIVNNVLIVLIVNNVHKYEARLAHNVRDNKPMGA